jgi:ribonuclease G
MMDEQLENKVSYYAQDKGLKYLELHVSPYISSYLSQGFWSIRRRWQWRYKCRIKLLVDQSIGIAETKFYDKKGREIG